MRRIVRTLLAAALCAPAPALAQPGPPCAGAEHREFDFWVGEWKVTTPDGKPAGRNRIERILGGCVLYESWSGAGGSTGHSFSQWDARRGVWHQTWVDTSGAPLLIDGGLVGGAMVLTGDRPAADGSPVRHRITWTPLPDGRVHQHWQASRDAGATWTTVFDGTYHRQDPAPTTPAPEPPG